MEENNLDFLNKISNYYSEKIIKFGERPEGVDWNSSESQLLRFTQLRKIIDHKKHFSINDLGCGYGALFDFLIKYDNLFSYLGIDISETMIQAATKKYANNQKARFINANAPDRIADYVIASGIFNVKLDYSDDEWLNYIKHSLNIIDQTSSRGFAFNCLTSYSDMNKQRNDLYYANPCLLFDICKRKYSKNVALLHDYGLYEFTILVRKY